MFDLIGISDGVLGILRRSELICRLAMRISLDYLGREKKTLTSKSMLIPLNVVPEKEL